MCSNDVLQPILKADILKLRQIYEAHLPQAAYVYNYLSFVMKWQSQRPDKTDILLMAPDGNWSDGTFVAVHEFSCYELFMYTLEKDGRRLCNALEKTKKIKWTGNLLLYAITTKHYPAVLEVFKSKVDIANFQSGVCDVWWIPKEKAQTFEVICPSEVYIGTLEPKHAVIINNHWPHRYEDSDKFLAIMIGVNGGCGVFLKSNGTLVAWVIRNFIGLGVLQTMEEHKRKGYGSLACKVLAKQIAQDGFDPLGTVLIENVVSQALFEKLGFERCETVVFCENQEIESK